MLPGRKSLCLLVITFLFTGHLFAQTNRHHFEGSVGIHGMIPNAPEFPEVSDPSVSLSFRWYDRSVKRMQRPWWLGMNKPSLFWGGKFQSLGNDAELGHTFSLVRGFEWAPKKRPHSRFRYSGALGLSWLDRYYRPDRADNLVNGGPFSFNMQWALTYRFGQGFSSRLIWDHYSSGGRFAPNRGYNLLGLEIAYRISGHSNEIKVAEAPAELVREDRWHPFVRGIYGITQRNLSGPDYPVTGIQAGVFLNSGLLHQWRFGGEWLRDESNRVFLRETGIGHHQARVESTRYLLSAGHGFRLDHLVLVTDVGVYLSRHYNRGGLFSTRIGLEYQNTFSRKAARGGYFAGIYVRSYGLEADFTEFSAGLYF